MPVRLKDIAAHLGLSITTVSRALAGYPDVAEKTRQRVLQAAEEMGYYPNATARRLQRCRADTIGFIIPTSGPRFSDPFFSEFLAGIGNEASRQRMDLLVATHPPGPTELETYRRWAGSRRVDGFLLVRTRRNDPRIRFLAERGIPFVSYGRSQVEMDFPYVGVDGERGMYEATQYLIELGHQEIAYIGGPAELQFSMDRLSGVRRALEGHGLALRPDRHVEGQLTEESGYRCAQQLLTTSPRPTAIMCANDLMALGAMRAVQEQGLQVGPDVAVTGFDDIPVAAHAFPPLTTVRQPIYQIGTLTCRMLVRLIRSEELEERHILLTPELIVRRSTER